MKLLYSVLLSLYCLAMIGAILFLCVKGVDLIALERENPKPDMVYVQKISEFDGKTIYIITDKKTKKEYIGFTGVGMCERNNKITIEEK